MTHFRSANPSSAVPLDGDILGPEDDDPVREERVRRRFWPTFRKAARHIPFARDLVAAYFCALDPATPRRVRLTLIAALAYFVLPIDAVPDLLAGIGFTDDVTVLLGAIGLVGRHIEERHRAAADMALADEDKA